MSSWKLTDGEAIALANKYTFFKPSREMIAALRPGEFVQLIFEVLEPPQDGPGAERMWVEIVNVHGDGNFSGMLRNDPRAIAGLRFGDPVAFAHCHIIKTERKEAGGLPERYSSRCFASNKVLTDGAKVGKLWREEPHTETDSGWRFMAGDESGGYMIKPSNSQCVSLGAVLRCDDAFVDLLESPAGSRFRRRDGTDTFDPDDSTIKV